jgi:plastocyanin
MMVVAVVAAVALDAGWFPPSSAGAGDGGASPGPSAAPSGPSGQITIVAEAVKFDLATLNVPADTAFKLALDNRDPGTPHDVDILGADGNKIFDGQDFPGVEIRVYDVPPIPAGTYPFICSIHPDLMKGELIAGS